MPWSLSNFTGPVLKIGIAVFFALVSRKKNDPFPKIRVKSRSCNDNGSGQIKDSWAVVGFVRKLIIPLSWVVESGHETIKKRECASWVRPQRTIQYI